MTQELPPGPRSRPPDGERVRALRTESVSDAPPSSSGRLPIDDPFLARPEPVSAPAERASISTLAISSVIAPLVLGPVGAVLAIVFGLAARREIESSRTKRSGYALATAGVALGTLLTMAWGAGTGFYVWSRRVSDPRPTVAAVDDPEPRHDSPSDTAAPTPTPSAPRIDAAAGPSVPKHTRVQRIGSISVVDIGIATSSFAEELAKQRAEASAKGETVLVMTTAEPCEPCRGVDKSLRDPLMQTALAKIRLVRVDIGAFKEDLEQQRMQRERFPAFFLLAVDLTPKDAIDGGEWDDDIAPNIAPVLGAFVRGKYSARRQVWQPLPGSGVRL